MIFRAAFLVALKHAACLQGIFTQFLLQRIHRRLLVLPVAEPNLNVQKDGVRRAQLVYAKTDQPGKPPGLPRQAAVCAPCKQQMCLVSSALQGLAARQDLAIRTLQRA